MKNNKGYTLVELLVTLAVFALIMAELGNMMMNSSKLYRNGTYEVELQTEAQQIVQQMGELLIDVNDSISTNYQPSLSSDYITISNNDAIYQFRIENMDLARGYGDLYYYKESLDGSASSNHVLMAEYVQSISLNMANYTSDVVTLNVSMNNGRYGYQASQDIYLRNQVGSGGNSGSSGGTFDYDLDVLRFREYDLSKLYDTEDIHYTFAWDSADAVAASTVYDFTNASCTKLTTSDTTNRDAAAHQYYTLLATGDDAGHTVLKIRVGTKKVDFGTGNVGLMNAYTGTTMLGISAVPVQGIDVTKADTVTMTLKYYTGPSSGVQDFDVYVYDGHDGNSNPGITVEYRNNPNFAQARLGSPLYWKTNEAVNTFDIYCNGFFADQCNGFATTGDSDIKGYEAYMAQTGMPLYFNVSLVYNGYQTVSGTVFIYPYNKNMGSQESNFWEKVGWVH